MPAFATPEPITAKLTTGGAKVRITAGERPDAVVSVEPIDSTNPKDVKVAENTKVEFSAGELLIETVKAGHKNGSVAITIELPAGSNLVLQTAWSNLYAEGQFGNCELDLLSGKVQLEQIAALHGRLAAGEVSIGHVAGTVLVNGGTAELRIDEVEGAVKYEGSHGKVSIGVAHADVELTGANGTFSIDRADANVTAKAANCPIRIGRLTRGEASLMNAARGIDIGIAHGTTASVDAESTKGEVHNTVPAQDGPADDVKVYARTRRDNITIHPAA